MDGKRPSDSQITLTQLMGPTDANTLGNVHGGFIMKLCDEAGGMAATKHARRPAVTVTVDSMNFPPPVKIGNVRTAPGEVTGVGRPSREPRGVVTAENVITGAVTHTNTAYFVYVALDENGRPVPVPPLILETEEEKARFERAAQRQARRLQQRHQESL